MSKRMVCADQFSSRLNQLLIRHEMTIAAAAKLAGVSKSTLNNWLGGVRPTNFEAIAKLARVLGTSLNYLLVGEVKPDGPGISLSELLGPSELVYDGYLKIRIERINPNGHKKEEDGR
jgi:transcriptional regulator with XRE-family HTH domain